MKPSLIILITLVGANLLPSCKDKKEHTTQKLETSGYQATPADFLRAAENGDTDALKIFVKQGTDLATKNKNGWTALHLSVLGNRQESVAYLLDAGMDIETPGPGGITPLMLAASEKNSTMIRYLLKQGAKAELKDNENRTALIHATDANHPASIEELAPFARNQLDTALLYASAQGKHEVIETLTSFGASVYVRHEGGMTPLMLAAEHGHTEAVSKLLDNGANRYAVNEHGWTAAQVADANNQETIATLLNENPDPEELTINEPSEEEGIQWTHTPEPSNTPDTNKTPLVKKNIPFITGKTLPSQATTVDEITSELTMLDYQEKPLPLMLEKTTLDQVGGDQAEIRMLYGDQKKVILKEGDPIPNTRFRVISIKRILNHSKITDGQPTDVSTVEIEDTTTGKRRKMTARIPATAAEPWAVLHSKTNTEEYAVRTGQQFQTTNGQSYTISDVRPNQLIITQQETGETITIPLGHYDKSPSSANE